MLRSNSIFVHSPSFTSYSSHKFAEIATKVCEEFVDDREELGLEPVLLAKETSQIGPIHEEQEEQQGEIEEEVEEEETGNNEEINDEDESDDDDDFEFSFVCRDPDESSISADEIFVNGQIKPIYPIFNRDLIFAGCEDDDEESKTSSIRVPLKNLFIEERESTDLPSSSSSSEADELENLPEGTYCVWKPNTSSQSSPETCKKSNSTGSSSSKRWKLRDFPFRSNSDGKNTFVFLNQSDTGKVKSKDQDKLLEKGISSGSSQMKHSGEVKVAGKGKSKFISTGEALPSAHEIHYVRNRALKQSDRRKSYLPYRQDLVGFFTNVNGLSRNLHPF